MSYAEREHGSSCAGISEEAGVADVMEIERQARKWLVRMDGDKPLSDAEKRALQEWMSRGVLHRQELLRLARFWKQANVLTELAVDFGSARRKHGGSRRWTILMTAACASLCSVMLAYCSLGQLTATETHTYRTDIGQQKAIFLPDGSSIKLNTNSEVKVSYSVRARTVHLVRGEGLFTVASDPLRAFEVYAADSVIRAVGTAFAVHLEGHRIDVTVEKGVVDLSDVERTLTATSQTSAKAAPLVSRFGRLRAGEVASFDSGSGHMDAQRIDDFELRLRMAWEDGCLAFAGEPLSEVVTQLNRYSTTRLVIGDPQLASLAIGGRFKVSDLDVVLKFLRTTFGIQARRASDGTLRLESGPAH
jgi:transmembrane sensor